MLQESLDSYFVIVAVAVGAISILVNWFYMIETAKGIDITEFSVLKKYVNVPFIFSLAMLCVLWITSSEIDALLVYCFWGLTGGWFLTVLGALILPSVLKAHVADKKSIRRIILPCVVKVVIMAAVLWLVY